MEVWLDFYRSSEARVAALPEAPVNERAGQKSECSGGVGGGVLGGRGVSSLNDTDVCLCHADPTPPLPQTHLGLRLSAPNSHFINQDDLSPCEFISPCVG